MKISLLKTLSLGAATLAIVAGAPAEATTINLIDTGGVAGSPAAQGFALAARYWESVLTNNATINIQVGFQDLGPQVLGGTRTSLYTYVPMESYYGLLDSNENKSAIDRAALANLQPLNANGGVDVVVPGYYAGVQGDGVTGSYRTRVAPTDQAIGNTIAIASANVKALINDASFAADTIDASINFSSTFAFDFNPSDGVPRGSYDFIGVAIHEIGHALGFLSGVEDFDASAGTSGYPVDDYWWGYAADMFRYSKPGTLDWSFGTSSYFSLDGGYTPYDDGYWSTGSTRGDGWQASHWKEPGIACTNLRGIMNPYICDGSIDAVSGLDLALLDTIGWNINFDVNANKGYSFTTAQVYDAFGVPEPATWTMMIVGMGLVGGAMRRRSAGSRLTA